MIKFYASAQQAKPGPPLSPILGQHQIKVAEFVPEFNGRTTMYSEGLPLGCRIVKKGSKWTLHIRPPTTSLLLGGSVTPVRLWAALELRYGSVRPAHARLFLGSARSGRINIDG